jgi:hypothetical protein
VQGLRDFVAIEHREVGVGVDPSQCLTHGEECNPRPLPCDRPPAHPRCRPRITQMNADQLGPENRRLSALSAV